MGIVVNILLFLLALVFLVELSTGISNSKHKTLTALGLLIFSGAAIHFNEITSVSEIYELFAVMMFVVSGVYLSFKGANWLRG